MAEKSPEAEPAAFAVVRAIMDEILNKDGGDICKADLYRRSPEVAAWVIEAGFDIIPSRGQMLKHRVNGIRHAKFSPSKSIAIVWEKIGDTIYVTFDDHAPVRYHRAIAHLREIKLGKRPFARNSRNRGWFYRLMKESWSHGHRRRLKGFSASDRYYE